MGIVPAGSGHFPGSKSLTSTKCHPPGSATTSTSPPYRADVYDCISFTTDYGLADGFVAACHGVLARDRKSTRLNSSHSQISYAVFCLKKKKTLYKDDYSNHISNATCRTGLRTSSNPCPL